MKYINSIKKQDNNFNIMTLQAHIALIYIEIVSFKNNQI
jgi:hypothetical protein